jgi:ATP-dependent Clp protease protease subunit
MHLGSEFEKYAVKHLGLSSNTLNGYEKYLVTGLTPNIIEERPMNVAVMDVYSRLMMDRIIFLGYPINDEVANIITAQLLFLDSTDRHRDIQMYINSPGGSVYYAVCDTGCGYHLYRYGGIYGSNADVCRY